MSTENGQDEDESIKHTHVLVIEDDVFQQVRIESIIRQLEASSERSIDVTLAESSYEAKSLLLDRSPEYDLVIADVFLKEGDTSLSLLDFCTEKFPDTKLIYTSGESIARIVSRCGSTTARQMKFVSKLSALETYKSAIKKLVESRQAA